MEVGPLEPIGYAMGSGHLSWFEWCRGITVAPPTTITEDFFPLRKSAAERFLAGHALKLAYLPGVNEKRSEFRGGRGSIALSETGWST